MAMHNLHPRRHENGFHFQTFPVLLYSICIGFHRAKLKTKAEMFVLALKIRSRLVAVRTIYRSQVEIVCAGRGFGKMHGNDCLRKREKNTTFTQCKRVRSNMCKIVTEHTHRTHCLYFAPNWGAIKKNN